MTTDQSSFTCPQCLRTSRHPEDVKNRYCGACHEFMDLIMVRPVVSLEDVASAMRRAANRP